MIASGSQETRPSLLLLTTRIHRQIIDAMDLARAAELDEGELRQQIQALAAHLCARQDVELTEPEAADLVQRIMDEIYGLGPLQPLMQDPEVTDIMVTGARNVQVERLGRLEHTDISFADDEHLTRFIQRTVARAGRRIDEVSPVVEVRLSDGSRLNAVIPPLAVHGPTLSIRRFSDRRLSLEDLVRLGSLAPEMADFLVLAVRNRSNLVISGGSGAGKTTLLNCLSRFIPAGQRVVTIEETAELCLQHPDVVALESRLPNVEGRGGVSMRDLVRHALRIGS